MNSGFTSPYSNSRNDKLFGVIPVPEALTDILSNPKVKMALLGLSFLTLLIIIISAATGGGGGGNSKYPPRASLYGIDCTNMPDMLFGADPIEHNGHYYQLVGGSFASMTWFESLLDATHRCHNGHTGYLATIESKEENDFLLRTMKADYMHFHTTGHNDAWIGGTDMQAEGDFEWFTDNKKTDGKKFWTGGDPINGGKPVSKVFSNFENSLNGGSAHEPNSNGEEDCVAFQGGHNKDIAPGTTDGMWNDAACYSRIPYFIVEFDK